VSRQPQRTLAQQKRSIEELSELEAAAAALREQFLARFRQIRTDSAAHFHKEMVCWPSTKRLMRIDPRDKFWIVPNDADHIRWMRGVFTRFLDALSAELAQPKTMERFINDLGLMRPHVDWVKREAREIWPLLRKECLLWAQVACDGQATGRDWRAPGWLHNWPADVPPKVLLTAARVERLDADRTARVVKEIAKRIKDRLAPVQESALDNLRVRLLLEEETACQTARAADAKAATNAKGKSHEPVDNMRAEPTDANMGQEANADNAKSSRQGRRERGPDKKMHQERVELEDTLISELAAIRDRLGDSASTLDELHKRFPFKVWTILSPTEQEELLAKEFKPKAYARALTARKFGVSEEAIKKSRQTLRRLRDAPNA
jgi:chemotaxis protein histidine kinase CheA